MKLKQTAEMNNLCSKQIYPYFTRKVLFSILGMLLATIPCSVKAAPYSASVAAWGSNTTGQTVVPADLTNIAAIAAGVFHNVAVRNDGTVVAWGDNAFNRATPPAGLNNVAAVGAGINHSLALKVDGSLSAWGANDGGQCNLPVSGGVARIAVGDNYNLALLNTARLIAWGAKPLYMPAELTNGTATIRGMAAGPDHAVAIKVVGGTGRAVGWGRIDNGLKSPPENLTNGINDVVAVAAGGSHCMALRSDGIVQCWGSNYKGQTTVPSGLNSVVAIAAGGDCSFALRSDGLVFAWGDAAMGQLSIPSNLAHVVGIAAGRNHALALYHVPLSFILQPISATVLAGNSHTFTASVSGSQPVTYQWQKNGTNIPGAVGPMLQIQNVQGTNAGTYRIVVSNPVGTLTSTNSALTVLVPPAITAQPTNQVVVQGAMVTLRVTASGSTPMSYQWRKGTTNISGANGPAYVIFNVQSSHAGLYSVLITNIAGKIQSDSALLTVLIPPVIQAQPLSQTVLPGSSVSFSVTAQGAINYQWRLNGTNITGAIFSTLTLNSVQAQDAGSYTVAISNDGGQVISKAAVLTVQQISANYHLVPWGQSNVFVAGDYVDVTPPGGVTNAVAIAVGANHSLALREDGVIVGWGDNTYGQASAAGYSNVTAIAAGQNYSLALLATRRIAAWGLNNAGQLTVPTNLNDAVAIAAGANHCLALRINGTVVGWGDSAFGKTVAPAPATNIIAISAGLDHSLALRANGTVVAWGGNDDNQAQVPVGLSDVKAIAAGSYHSLALKSNGVVVAWGAGRAVNNYGQTQVPSGLSRVVAIAAGGTHSLALLDDSTVVCWGNNNYGQCDAPTDLNGVVLISGGPYRSLALRLKPLQLSVQTTMAGFVNVFIRHGDGSNIESSRMNKIEILHASDASLPLAQWQTLEGSYSLINGAIQINIQGVAPNTRHFYQTRQRP